jgi:hypothetical protein
MDSKRIDRALTEAAHSLKRTYLELPSAVSPPPKRISLKWLMELKGESVNEDSSDRKTIYTAKVLFGKRSRSSATDRSSIWEKALTDTPIKHAYALAANYNALLQRQIKSEYHILY